MRKSNKSFWMSDENQVGDFSNDKIDTFDPAKGYIGIRLQQGVPLLDRDWNELEDIRRYQEVTFRKSYIGDGSPDQESFKIAALVTPANDFMIKKGRYLLDGFDIENTADKKFSEQADTDRSPTTLTPPRNPPRADAVYLEAWISEISSTGIDADPDLANPKDVNMLTCLRHKLKWAVKVAEGKEMPASEQFVHRSLLATIARTGSAISSEQIFDKRSKLRTLVPGNEGHLRVNGPLDVTGGLLVEDGNVGIGTTDPKAKLHVSGDILLNGSLMSRTLVGLQTPAGDLKWHITYGYEGLNFAQTGVTDGRLFLKDNGNVGIGTTSPEATLHVAGNLRIDHGSTAGIKPSDTKAPGLRLKSENNGGLIYGQDTNHSIFFRIGLDKATDVIEYHEAGMHKFFTGGALDVQKERLRIDSNGNVGIGTNSPTGKLDVSGDIRAGNSDIYFTKTDHKHTGIGNTDGYAAIENASDYGALMILGRAGTPKGRKVQLWDYLQVNGGMDISGNVGIGTTSPEAKLHVVGKVYIDPTGTQIDPKKWKHDGWIGGIRTWDIEAQGTIWAAHVDLPASDLAENYPSDDGIEPGDVVCLSPDDDKVVLSRSPNDPLALGVVSTNPGMLLNSDIEEDNAAKTAIHPIALSGRVPCKVTDEGGPIAKGDLLTSSSTPGCAMKARPMELDGQKIFRQGTIMGKALNPLLSGKGLIDIFVFTA